MILRVPFVDVLSSMTDPTLPLTVHEYDEWGNPAEEPVREYIKVGSR
jgi:oligopeptidase B